MGRIRTIKTPWVAIAANVADPSDNGFTPATGYIPAGPIERARMTIETRNRIGSIEVIGAANFAQSELVPNATGTNLGSTWISSATLTTPSTFTDLSSTSDDYQLARFGFVTRLASGQSGTGLIEARARIDVLLNDDMQRLAVPFMTVYGNSDTTPLFFPATGWYNSVEVVRARGLFEVQARTGTLNFAWAYQLTNDPTNPGTSATIIGSYAQNPSGVQYPSGFTTIDPTSGQLVRFGWLCKRSSGSSFDAAQIGGQLEFGRS